MVGYKNSKHKEIVMTKKNTEKKKEWTTQFDKEPIPAKETIQPKSQFLTKFVKIAMTGEDKGDVLVIDLEDYFERIHRQGWACVKRERT